MRLPAKGLIAPLVFLTLTANGALWAQHSDEVASGSQAAAAVWRMPPTDTTLPMLPGLAGLTPNVTAWLPGGSTDAASLPEATFRSVEQLADGDTLHLRAMLVRRTLGERTLVMYGYNGQYPGPLIMVPHDATIFVDFKNELDLPSTIHWHGIRLENASDGVPDVTQEPVEPGGRFLYKVHFRDAGIYWYHPHVRTDIQQELGLYGNILVREADPAAYNAVNREEILALDDLLLDARGLFPFGEERAVQTLMGRFGNVYLVNGKPEYELEVARGSVVRFFLTNVSSTRTFNLTFGDAPIKLVGADVSRFEHEEWVMSVVIGPAQRYIVEVLFENPGEFRLTNRIQAIDHMRGRFESDVDTLGVVRVLDEPTVEDHGASFGRLREHSDVIEEIDRYRKDFGRPVDHELVLTMRVGGLPVTILQLMTRDTLYRPPAEFNDAMPVMNYLSTGDNVIWVLRDPATGLENMDIRWRFKLGEVVKIRLFNDPQAAHPMHHPMHIHGQRFLVLARDGVPNENLVWKDTAIVPVSSRIDILLELSNPGSWLAHCHISEHVEAGMKMVLTVVDEP